MHFIKTLFTVSLVLCSIGCVTTKYSHINVMENSKIAMEGKHVDRIWVGNEAASEIRTNGLIVENIVIDSIKDEKGISRNECLKYLEKQIEDEYYKIGIVSKGTNPQNCKLTFIFTNMSPGNAASRVWAGELGFGHANVEIQAIIKNADGKRIVEISDSRNNSGAIGFRDTFGDAGPTLVKELIKQISENILKELKLILGNN